MLSQRETGTPGRSAALPSRPSATKSGQVRNSVHFYGLTPSIHKTSPFFISRVYAYSTGGSGMDAPGWAAGAGAWWDA